MKAFLIISLFLANSILNTYTATNWAASEDSDDGEYMSNGFAMDGAYDSAL